MAKILDERRRYVSPEALAKRRRILAGVLAFTALLFSVSGVFIGVQLQHSALYNHALAFCSLVALLWLVFVWCRKKIEGLEQEAPAGGPPKDEESPVERSLKGFPDAFMVVPALKMPIGTADYVITGPTGVFVLEEKNWTGGVSADGNGELLWNGYAPDRPLVREFADRVGAIQNELVKLQFGPKVQARGLLVFTAATLDIKWDMHGVIECIHGEQLHDRIVQDKYSPRLKQDEVESIAKALVAMARAGRAREAQADQA